MVKSRKTKVYVKDEDKTQEYWVRRNKNTLSAKKTRLKKNMIKLIKKAAKYNNSK